MNYHRIKVFGISLMLMLAVSLTIVKTIYPARIFDKEKRERFNNIPKIETSEEFQRLRLWLLQEEEDTNIISEAIAKLIKADKIDPALKSQLIVDILKMHCEKPAKNMRQERVRAASVYRLMEIGDTSIPIIKNALTEAEGEYKKRLTLALISCGDKTYLEHILTFLKDDDGFIRAIAARVAWKINYKEAIPTLIELLKDEFYLSGFDAMEEDIIPIGGRRFPVRGNAATALRQMGINVKRVGKLGEDEFIVEESGK